MDILEEVIGFILEAVFAFWSDKRKEAKEIGPIWRESVTVVRKSFIGRSVHFQLHDGKTKRLLVPKESYEYLEVGMMGILSYQGGRFISFS